MSCLCLPHQKEWVKYLLSNLLKIIAFAIFELDEIQSDTTRQHCGSASSIHISSYITEKAFDVSSHFEKFCLRLPNQKE